MDGFTKFLVAFLGIVAVLLFYGSGAGTTSAEDAKATLLKSGFTSVQTGGVSYFECSDSDLPGREFVATNPAGQSVRGVVCCGLFKACTVRF